MKSIALVVEDSIEETTILIFASYSKQSKNSKSACNNNSPRYSKSRSSLTKGFASSNNVSIGNHTHLKKDWIEELSF